MKGQLRIEQMYAFVVLDTDGTEGVPAFMGPDGMMMPMVGADMKMIDKLRPHAQQMAKRAGIKITALPLRDPHRAGDVRVSFIRRGIAIPATATEEEAMRVAHDALISGARGHQATFTKPDDDWFPVWMVITPDHGTIISGNLHKRVMAKRVGAFARRVGATAIGHLHSSWAVFGHDVDPKRWEAIHAQMLDRDGDSSDIPERHEILLLNIVTGSQQRAYTAPIIRYSDKPPSLGEFEGHPPGMMAQGAMVDPLTEALTRQG